jgi:hypothetical protein
MLMHTATGDRLAARLREREAEQREFRLALRIGFAIFLLAALALRLVPRHWRPAPFSSGEPKSVIAEARSAAHTIVPIAFMR